MYILVKNGIVIAKGDLYEQVDNGILIGGYIYPDGEIILITDQEVTPQKHKYIGGAIVINEDYVNSVEAQIQQAIDNYTLELLEKGLL